MEIDFDFLDFHTHHPTNRAGVASIQSIYFEEKKSPKTSLVIRQSSLKSVGIHPWFLPKNMEAAMRWLRFEAVQNEVVALGEAGLDRSISTDFEAQGIVFMQVARLAEEVEKPLILHVVRAEAEILAFKKALQPRQTWIVHGFAGHPNSAKSLLAHGFCLSFGEAILKNERAAAALAATPADSFFLETDDRPQLFIEDIYERAAAIRGVSLAEIQGQIQFNFEVIFGN